MPDTNNSGRWRRVVAVLAGLSAVGIAAFWLAGAGFSTLSFADVAPIGRQYAWAAFAARL
jgi:hypothetical protein